MTKENGKPQIRFAGFDDAWEQRKLGEMFKYEQPQAYIVESTEYDDRYKIPVLTAGQSFILGYTDEKFGIKNANSDKPVVIFDDFTTSAHYVDFPFKVKSSAMKLLSLANEKDDIHCAYNVLQNIGYEPVSHERHWISTFAKFSVYMPKSSVEQKCIGDYFASLDNLITLHQRKYEKLTNVKKSMLEKMFPKNGSNVPEIRFKGFTEAWEQRKLGDLVIDHNAGIYISKEDYGEGTNVIGVGNIYDSDIFDGEIYRLGPVNDDKFILEENDIIYGESSLVPEGIARTVCVGKNGAGSAFAWHTRRVKLNQNIVNSHVATLELNYLHEIRKYLVSVSTQTALTGMTTEGYFGATLSLPSVEEQQKISDYFKNLDHLITLHQRELEKLQNIKKACLEKMFV